MIIESLDDEGVGVLNYSRAYEDVDKWNIDERKEVNNYFSQARDRSKRDTCNYCGENVSALCKSHFVPKYCLKNIASKGEVNTINSLVHLPTNRDSAGVKNAGTFQLICRKCDGRIFQDYENPQNFDRKPTQVMMAQIAMKNYLKYLSKRHLEKEMYQMACEKDPYLPRSGGFEDICCMDISWYNQQFELAKMRSLEMDSGKYHLYYFTKVDYVVPIAFQSGIVCLFDFESKIINDIYNFSSLIWELHVCIFPLDGSSIVMIFVDNAGMRRYTDFFRKFKKLSEIDKLALINYMIFLYSEDMYLSPKIPNEVWNNKKLIEVAGRSLGAYSDINKVKITQGIADSFDLNKYNEIPNLLSSEYQIQ